MQCCTQGADQSGGGRSSLLMVEMFCSLMGTEITACDHFIWKRCPHFFCISRMVILLYQSWFLFGINRKDKELNCANQENSQHTPEFLEDGGGIFKSSQIVPQINEDSKTEDPRTTSATKLGGKISPVFS